MIKKHKKNYFEAKKIFFLEKHSHVAITNGTLISNDEIKKKINSKKNITENTWVNLGLLS
jgi:hypothetical protein